MKRRNFITLTALGAGAIATGLQALPKDDPDLLKGIRDFIYQVANEDGSFRPGIDPSYPGKSDTGLSGIAAPTYAVILAKTFGWELPYPDRTLEFFSGSQHQDGAFYASTGSMDMSAPLAKLYNTTQSIVALRLMGKAPKYDPIPVVDYFFEGEAYKELPLYTTSFFPLFFCALGRPMPDYIDERMRHYILDEQEEDGYLQNHVAATFHAAHYFRLAGEPVPKAEDMVNRVINDQQQDGSWHLFEPDWDVHACFDALFILRQLGDQEDGRIQQAYHNAIQWILSCHKSDGGFTHFPDWSPSDMDAVYFQAGGLVEAGYLKTSANLSNEEILGWGHALDPKKTYSCI